MARIKKEDFLKPFHFQGADYSIFDINLLEKKGLADIRRLPYSIKVLVENLLRKLDGRIVEETDLLNIARWRKTYQIPVDIPFHPARVLMHDFTGIPALVDMAAMRDAVNEHGGDPYLINPEVPVDLIIDHSVQIDYFGTTDALKKNVEKEYQRNKERYAFLKWAQKNFDNFQVVPPKSGICHQVNLEYLGRVVVEGSDRETALLYPDTLVGTDSHTPMINGIGIVGWGVGGIEAEAVMLGQPYNMSIPEVIGVRLIGRLKDHVTPTDLVLTVTELLRKHNVVEKFVEYFGPGLKQLTVPGRATLANMAPEYGATMGFFPIDEQTIAYLTITHRGRQAQLAEKYAKETGLFYTDEDRVEYTQVLELDLSTVELCVAGPSRPQDRIPLSRLKDQFDAMLIKEFVPKTPNTAILKFEDESGYIITHAPKCEPDDQKLYPINLYDKTVSIGNGSIVIAAITSCTNTSNPYVMLGAGLVAKKAVEKGLEVPDHVKTSLAPGSTVVLKYLQDSGLMPYLEALGFHISGFGCTTCIGNSGPLHPVIEQSILENDLTVAAVLSGNRNFEARIHQRVRANFLASPMLVVALAISGRIDTDLSKDPIGLDPNGAPVFLKDIWPDPAEIEGLIQNHVKEIFFQSEYDKIFEGDALWGDMPIAEHATFAWDPASTYIQRPPYFENFNIERPVFADIRGARALLALGDSITTDHISPASAIPENYPSGQYLMEKNVAPQDFNSYGSRRGNHNVMIRGTFGNIRLKNRLVSPREGGFTLKFPEGREMLVYDAACKYQEEGTPLIIIAGQEYGSGSSRDWAAKGPYLLGVKAIIAESYERIHRNNLLGMGVLPLEFKKNTSWKKLGLDGSETFSIYGFNDMKTRKTLQVQAIKKDGGEINFDTTARLDTDVEVAYFINGGIMPYVLRKVLQKPDLAD
ncbi:MAG: aconitate hydratase AcnA [Desulfobacterales bacterium]|nr:aconitate hydratase AcnA [Desulfobacterales bacterium]